MKRKFLLWTMVTLSALTMSACGLSAPATSNSPAVSTHTESSAPIEGLNLETYTCQANGEKGAYYVYLPANYDANRRYPSIYLMPYDGYSADPYISDGLLKTYADILATDTVQDMILILPEYSSGQDYDLMLSDMIADVDAKYQTISDMKYRGILGVKVGAYMAYEAVLNRSQDLFLAAGAHMGDYISEANPYLSKGSLSAMAADLDKQDASKGYNFLSDHYFYMDAPNQDPVTTAEGSAIDIGSELQKRSNPYYQYGYSVYNTPDNNLVSYNILDGNTDSTFYLTNLSRSLAAFSEKFTQHLYSAAMEIPTRAIDESISDIQGKIDISFSNLAEKYGTIREPAELIVELWNADHSELLNTQTYTTNVMENLHTEFTFEKSLLGDADAGTLSYRVSLLGKIRDIDQQNIVLLKTFKPGDTKPGIDLRGDWYFNAYKTYDTKTVVDLDSIESITPETYTGWGIVQPGFGWWTKDFDSSLKGQENYAGYAWYVRTFNVNPAFPKDDLVLSAGYFDEANEVYINGKRVGSTGMNYVDGIGIYDDSNPWDVHCIYDLPADLLNYGGENTIAIRMCNSDGGGGWYDGPIGIYTQDTLRSLDSGNDRILEDTYISAALNNQEQTFRIYLPEGCDPSDRSKTYPVLYLLHGINSTGKSFVIDGIDQLMDAAIASGELEPMIVVMPDDPTKQSFWQGSYTRMVAEDLVAAVEEKYPVATNKEHRYIAGCSMGGAGAMHIGLSYPDKFSGIGSFYGAFSYVKAIPTASKMDENTLKGYRIWMACGNRDMYDFYVDQEYMSRLLTKKGVDHYHFVDNGAHTSEFYLPHFIQAVRYISNQDK